MSTIQSFFQQHFIEAADAGLIAFHTTSKQEAIDSIVADGFKDNPDSVKRSLFGVEHHFGAGVWVSELPVFDDELMDGLGMFNFDMMSQKHLMLMISSAIPKEFEVIDHTWPCRQWFIPAERLNSMIHKIKVLDTETAIAIRFAHPDATPSPEYFQSIPLRTAYNEEASRVVKTVAEVMVHMAPRRAYVLADGVELHRKHPETFYLPTEEEREGVKTGDNVKVIFECANGNRENTGERMWVEVRVPPSDHRQGVGLLCNTPFFDWHGLEAGHTVRFGFDNIISIEESEEEGVTQ